VLRLYHHPSSCALASHLALAESGAAYEAIEVDFANNAQTEAEYLSINPKGRVPALTTSQGTLTETPAILLYIAQTNPKADLAPLDDPFELAEVQSFNSYLCSTVHVNHAHNRRSYRWADEESSFEDMRRKVPQTMSESFDLIENGMLKGPWVMGEKYTICDPYLFTITRWLESDGVDSKRHPRVQDHMRRMYERPAVASVLGT